MANLCYRDDCTETSPTFYKSSHGGFRGVCKVCLCRDERRRRREVVADIGLRTVREGESVAHRRWVYGDDFEANEHKRDALKRIKATKVEKLMYENGIPLASALAEVRKAQANKCNRERQARWYKRNKEKESDN